MLRGDGSGVSCYVREEAVLANEVTGAMVAPLGPLLTPLLSNAGRLARLEHFFAQHALRRVESRGFRAQDSGFRIHGAGLRVYTSWFKVQGSGLMGGK